jgi:hypothetical protein
MTRPGLVDAEDLIRWADSFNVRADLPRLIRRLIIETGHDVVSLGFRAGAGVSIGGWDGTVRSVRATPHIPDGLSVWEISANQKVKQKADKDFGNRDSVPGSTTPADCTYVGVNIRRWGGRDDWEGARNAEGKWREVRFYDVDKIETWLEGAPVTHAWISEHLGLTPLGLRAAEKWFETWAGATDPIMPYSLVLAGRDKVADQLGERLGQPPQLITVRGSSLDDVLAFVASVGGRLAESDGGALLSRIAFVDQVVAWRRLESHPTPLVLVPIGEAVSKEATGASRHDVVVPVVGPTVADIELSPVDSFAAAEILKEAGLKERKAQEAGRLARFSILAVRRRLAVKPELHRPTWSIAPVSKLVRRLLFVGRWNESRDGDKQVVGTLLGGNYADLQDDLAGQAAAEDPIIGSVGSSTGLVSPYDAWLLIRETLRVEDLQAFEVAVRDVLLAPDPAYDLEPGERWMASIHGKVRGHSGDLRHGLATTLALLGALGDRVDAGKGATGTDWAGHLVRQVLDAANADESGRLWASLEDVLPLLAEAAPGRFLDAVRDGTQGDSPVLRKVFMDEGDGGVFAAHSPHTGLLWALETAAWSQDHFGQAVDLLVRLAELDPGGRLSNRPFNSLSEILCPWHPQNSVDAARRLSAIDGLRKRHPDIAWRLLLAMLPEHYAVAMPTHEPEYRIWKPQELAVTRPEYWAFIDEVVNLALEDVGDSADRWIEFLDKFDDLPPPARSGVREQLEQTVASGTFGSSAPRVWEQLRSLIARHRRFSDADWALPGEELDALEALARQFTPEDPTQEHGWLFEEQMPDLPEKHREDDDWERYRQRLADLRRDAVVAVDEQSGWPGIQALAAKCKFPWGVGVALADAESPHEARILELLASPDAAHVDLAMGYATRRFGQKSWEWLDPLLAESLSATQGARLLLATHSFPEAWERADQFGDEVADEFWRHFLPYGLGQDFEWASYAAGRLMAVGRNKAALELLNLYLRKEQSVEVAHLIATGLENLLDQDAPDVGRLDRHDILQLFEFLQSSELDWQRAARLEWSYASALDFEGRLTTLHRLMSEDPAFFVELMSRVFRASDEPRDDDAEVPEETSRIATNAYRVLSHWQRPPGLTSEGTIDGDVLNEWVGTARELLAEARRLDIGDVHIGKVLAHSPPDEDGVWPSRAVRTLLETLQNDKIEEGLQTEVHNQRGVTTRGLTEGGVQERDLVRKYREEAARLSDEWSRSAAILREIADDYEREARRSDEDAERFRRGFER